MHRLPQDSRVHLPLKNFRLILQRCRDSSFDPVSLG
jgi:hypothetical protein